MIFVVMGAPGAGKGTQCEKIAEALSALKLSTGDVLRKHIKNKTEIGERIQAIMDSGQLVSDEILIEVLKTEIPKNPDSVVLLDGYPRNVEQAKALDSLDNQKVGKAIHIDVPTEELLHRLSGRRVCVGCGHSYHVRNAPPKKEGICDHCGEKVVTRPDDATAKVWVRLAVYEKETKPVLEYYKKLGIYQRVDGNQPVEGVFADLLDAAKPAAAKIG